MKSSIMDERPILRQRAAAPAFRAHGLRRAVDVSQRRRDTQVSNEQVRAIDARLSSYPDPLAYLTPERFARNRRTGCDEPLGTGPRLAPRR